MRSSSRRQRRRTLPRAPGRRHLEERLEQARNGQPASERLEGKRRTHAPGIREDSEDQAPQKPLCARTLDAALDVIARELDQAVVLHSRRAGRYTGHAPEAAVEVLDHSRRELHGSVEQPFHEVDPAPRRIHLSDQSTHVGQVGRQKPQWTHSRRARDPRQTSTLRGSNSCRMRSASRLHCRQADRSQLASCRPCPGRGERGPPGGHQAPARGPEVQTRSARAIAPASLSPHPRWRDPPRLPPGARMRPGPGRQPLAPSPRRGRGDARPTHSTADLPPTERGESGGADVPGERHDRRS